LSAARLGKFWKRGYSAPNRKDMVGRVMPALTGSFTVQEGLSYLSGQTRYRVICQAGHEFALYRASVLSGRAVCRECAKKAKVA
jgi:hypothetical protein